MVNKGISKVTYLLKSETRGCGQSKRASGVTHCCSLSAKKLPQTAPENLNLRLTSSREAGLDDRKESNIKLTNKKQKRNRWVWKSDKWQTPIHGHRLRTIGHVVQHHQRTILQLVVQQICHIAMPEPNILTCQDVGMWQILSVGGEFVVQQVVELLWARPLHQPTDELTKNSTTCTVVQHVRSRCPCSGVWH